MSAEIWMTILKMAVEILLSPWSMYTREEKENQ